MTRLVELLKQAQWLATTVSNNEKITQEVIDVATQLNEELDELVGWFDPNWTCYEDGYVYDEGLIEIAKQFKRGEMK
jgi:hypothetical protein